jgi:hypothetical protein
VLGLPAGASAVGGAATGVAPSKLEAWFDERSYFPGSVATLLVTSPAASATVQLFHAGEESEPTRRNDEMKGVSVGDPVHVRSLGGPGTPLRLRLHFWESGLYFARVRAGGRTAFAPFVLRARRLGYHRVAIVLPTNTWQAYNLRDDDGDGIGDSWYASDAETTVRLDRPFLDRGVPPHYRGYDLGFLRWLERRRIEADFLAEDDLERSTGSRLARAYDLIVFPGHTEYVTPHAHDAITRYRDLGGNLIFLSANNFYYRIERQGNMIVRKGRWRDLGRPEAALVGSGYVGWSEDIHPNAPFVVTGADDVPWLFEGTGLRNGDRFGSFGIEIDARSAESPPGTLALARIPDAFGPGRSAEMTLYTTTAGARVFAAGAINFGGSALIPPLPALLANLWERFTEP